MYVNETTKRSGIFHRLFPKKLIVLTTSLQTTESDQTPNKLKLPSTTSLRGPIKLQNFPN